MLLFSKQFQPNSISGKWSELIEVREKLLCDLVMFLILSSKIPLEFNEKNYINTK